MKLREARGILEDILEIPPWPNVAGIILSMQKEGYPSSPGISNVLRRAIIFYRTWDRFEEHLENEERDLDEEARGSDIKLFTTITKRFFAPRFSRRYLNRHPHLKNRVFVEREEFLQAIEILSQQI